MHYLGPVPDLPLPLSGQRLRTRRKALAQLVLCQGCCCGQTGRGLPAVPLDYLKPIWKAEKLNKFVQLTVSGCLGPCDLPNVVCLVTPTEQVWYGRLTSREDYAVLVGWARQCRDQNQLLPPPTELEHLRFERWPSASDAEPFTPIAQDPADIVLLSAADTEILAWSAAAATLPPGFPTIRALNLDRLRDRRVFDAYLDDVLHDCRILLVRVLGGLGYWREPLESMRLLALEHDIAFLPLPGDATPDAALVALATVSPPIVDRAFRYCIAGGARNAGQLLRFLADNLLATKFGHETPASLPDVGIYHPDSVDVLDLASWRQRHCRVERPTAGLVFYRAHWVTGNLAPVDALVRALEERGLNVRAMFGSDLGSVAEAGLLAAPLDVLVTTTSFATLANREAVFGTAWQTPILQVIFSSGSENVWASNPAGLTPRDLAMNVALPEFDGRIITTAVSFKNSAGHDAILQTEIARYEPRADRIAQVAQLASHWARLRHLANAEKKVAILLANYPSQNARVGNAVGLDTPASLLALLRSLRESGYDTGSSLPLDGQKLITALIAASVMDREFASEEAHRRAPGQVSTQRFTAWLQEMPASARTTMTDRWGNLDRSPYFVENGVPVPGLRFGNVFVGVQPSRGYDIDPSAVYHSPDLPPPPFYLAFYRWLRDEFGAHAVIHLGKHGNLEWLPGKGTALSQACFPEIMLRDLPHIYPFIVNNPGEGTQAKRRTAAVIVDHLIPPMTRADTYGDLRRLELLLDEYYVVQGLDPAKAPALVTEIGELVEQSQLYRDLNWDHAPRADELPELLRRVDGYVCEIKEAQIRDGLHILGQLPDGEQLTDLAMALVRVDNGVIPGLLRALCLDLGLDYAALTRDLGADAPRCHGLQRRGDIDRDADRVWLSVEMRQRVASCRTCGDVVDALYRFGRQLVQEAWQGHMPGEELSNTRRTLAYLRDVLRPRLQQCTDEIANIVKALNGHFVPPGPSGAPTRGATDALPTGRNFYSLDVRAVPSPSAWRVGQAAADALLQRHQERTGSYPESVAVVMWGTSNLRTQGDDVAQVLALLGIKPRWDDANRRVIGLDVIPLGDLGRPRIDVMVRISGLFRDAFPHLVRLLNEAFGLVARLEEPLAMNYLRAHLARDTAFLCRPVVGGSDQAAGLSVDEAARRAGLRVFGSKPGAYGAGLLPLIDGRNWQTVDDIAEVYLRWGSFAYTGDEQADGHEERDAFRLRLSQTQVVVQNQDNREHDLFDSDDYFQFHGGLVAAVRVVRGQAPEAYIGDTSRPDDVRVRTLREEAYRVFRSRVVNPRWLAGIMRHGYKGAVEMAATVDYLFGYDATADVVDDWMYERLAEAYLFDDAVRTFVRRVNPWAERAMTERLLEAIQRGLWKKPDPNTRNRLHSQFLANEAWMEGS
jgi:cobaltochelatase CobN